MVSSLSGSTSPGTSLRSGSVIFRDHNLIISFSSLMSLFLSLFSLSISCLIARIFRCLVCLQYLLYGFLFNLRNVFLSLWLSVSGLNLSLN